MSTFFFVLLPTSCTPCAGSCSTLPPFGAALNSVTRAEKSRDACGLKIPNPTSEGPCCFLIFTSCSSAKHHDGVGGCTGAHGRPRQNRLGCLDQDFFGLAGDGYHCFRGRISAFSATQGQIDPHIVSPCIRCFTPKCRGAKLTVPCLQSTTNLLSPGSRTNQTITTGTLPLDWPGVSNIQLGIHSEMWTRCILLPTISAHAA